MKRSLLTGCFVVLLSLFSACTSAPAPEPSGPPPADVVGTWSGDWGPSASDRNPVTLQITSEAGRLGGSVTTGPNTVTLTAVSYAPENGKVTMEADAQGRGGAAIHYVIEGTAGGNMMTGTWSHDDVRGDFKVTKN
jgi:hypothetical protein